MRADDSRGASLLDLFRMEAETQTQVLTAALLTLERDPHAPQELEACMRAAHSLKGAARIIGLDPAVRLAHAMEDLLVAAQQAHLVLTPDHIDRLLGATDLLMRLAVAPPAHSDDSQTETPDVDRCLTALAIPVRPEAAPSPLRRADDDRPKEEAPVPAATAEAAVPFEGGLSRERRRSDRVLRVGADSLDRLLGLAGESLVESRWMQPFAQSLIRLKRMQGDAARALATLHETLSGEATGARSGAALAEAQRVTMECQRFLADRLVELDQFDRRTINLSHGLYDEALACRMRPFADGIHGFPRLVRDVAQALGKQARLVVAGESTQVDRDILIKLEAPLSHLLRNAIDHGIEAPDLRRSAAKPIEGTIRLEAGHRAGRLHVVVADDGAGIDVERIRREVERRNLVSAETAAKLSDDELCEFLFLPGFTMKPTVTEISGRGVGLDVVRQMVKDVHGTVRLKSELSKGTRFVLQLPVTLSVVRALLADIAGEPYAFPLTSIVRALKVPNTQIESLEGRQHFECDGQRVGLVVASQVLGLDAPVCTDDEVPVVIVGDETSRYGLVVDRFRGERELVLQNLDPRLGKIKTVSAGALMEDGSPVLILDPEDLFHSIDKLVNTTRLSPVLFAASARDEKRHKRVLVVDDSLTVRELERKLLASRGYDVEVAVDGMDGWHAVRTGRFDLVVTDIDMPRLDGIELVTMVNADPALKGLPIVIVSYKDRDEDRRRGLEAGAAYYLTKNSFQDETLLHVVADLVGEPWS